MVVKSYWPGVQLEKKPHPCVPFAESPREEFLPFPGRRGAPGDGSSKSCKLGYWASNAVKSLMIQSVTVSVLAAAVGSSPAAAQFLPPPPPPAPHSPLA